jgi:ABC-type sulfate transport system permease subunit
MLLKVIQFIAVLAAAAVLGNWYLAEYKKAKITGQPWYRAYFSLPGIIIAGFIILLPFIARLA